MVAVPPLGRIRPSSIRRVVVFPLPFGPRKPVTRPGSTSNSSWSTAVKDPKRFVRPRTSIRASVNVGSSCGHGVSLHPAEAGCSVLDNPTANHTGREVPGTSGAAYSCRTMTWACL